MPRRPGNVTLNTRKIVILGSRAVGKSSLVKQFVDNDFAESYHPSMERTFMKTIRHNGVDYPCELIDTAGQDEFSPLNSQHAIGIHGYVLVYSIDSRASFEMIQIIYDKITNYCGVREVPAIIVGSKADLHMSRQVDSTDGERLARLNKTAWIEASALRNHNVGNVFELCLAEIERGNAPVPPPDDGPRRPGCIVM
ncbi:small GTPase superfamily [Mycena latifolia]|nr:small GTPase superfamily [Mycena latifolia]